MTLASRKVVYLKASFAMSSKEDGIPPPLCAAKIGRDACSPFSLENFIKSREPSSSSVYVRRLLTIIGDILLSGYYLKLELSRQNMIFLLI